MTNLWWIRRDLRLHDQPTLHAAGTGDVVPLYILDPVLLRGAAPKRKSFLFSSLRSLDEDLRQRGAALVVRIGQPAQVLREVVGETRAAAVFAEEDFTPYARRRDAQAASVCDLRLVPGQTMFQPREIRKEDGTPYVVYTPYAKAWKRLLPGRSEPLPAPEHIQMGLRIASQQIPDAETNAQFPAGEAEARCRLGHFIRQRLGAYQGLRDRMDLEGTSALSPYLRFGVLSMRTVVAEAMAAKEEFRDSTARDSAETWLNELIWREFYIQILHHFPRVQRAPFRQQFAAVRWRDEDSELEAWKTGNTGVPIVDAGMRQLLQTGWMHNRARMITASYLVKDLLINWQLGERWFMDNLIDGDPAANNGGWQWTAGTGTDAAPYFRIFNPVLQSRRYDPEGGYIRRWVPELADIPTAAIHAPWEKGIEVSGYPRKPIVDHAAAIRRTRLAYEAARGGP